MAAAAGFVVLVHTLLDGMEIESRRALGFVMFAPVVFVVFGVICVVRAVRAILPWRAYLATTSAEQRRRDRAHDLQGGAAWQYWLFGVAALGGFVALAAVFVTLPDGGIRDVPGIILWFEFEVLLAMTAAGCLVLAVRTVHARRLLRETGASLAHEDAHER